MVFLKWKKKKIVKLNLNEINFYKEKKKKKMSMQIITKIDIDKKMKINK